MTTLLIPKKLEQALENLATTPLQLKHLQHLVGYLYRSYLHNGISFTEPIERSSEHFRKQVGWRPKKQLKCLLDAGIVIKVRSHCNFANNPKNKRCASYQFKADLLDPSLLHELHIELKADRDKKRNDKIIKGTKKVLKKLSLYGVSRRHYQRDISHYTNMHVTRNNILLQCKVGAAIPANHYFIGYIRPRQKNRFKSRVDSNKLLAMAERQGKQLILYRDKCYIEHLEYFIDRKLDALRLEYANSLFKILCIKNSNNLYCNRNETNNRLDTNITNIRSSAIDLLRIGGEPLIGFDLSNSQFAILGRTIETMSEARIIGRFGKDSTWLSNPFLDAIEEHSEYISALQVAVASCSDENSLLDGNVKRFIIETQQGRFYECFGRLTFDQYQRQTTCRSFDQLEQWKKEGDFDAAMLFNQIRSEAKKTMFQTLFSSYQYNPKSKATLKKHFPGLVKFCDTFKKEMIRHYKKEMPKKEAQRKGNASLAVMLQKIEASIFIDNILSELLSNGIKALSKHDSILCKQSEAGAVEGFVVSKLNAFFGLGRYQLKVERHF